MNKTTPVTLVNRDKLKLFGLLHEPDVERKRQTGIILLSPGVKMRVAPHRMYNKMADAFVEMGFPVLRFDFAGLGDAEGDIEIKQLSAVYNSIQTGRYVGDTLDAIDWMESRCGVSEFVVGGLCGGAITGLLAAQNDKRVAGLLGLGIPVALDVGEAERHKHLSKWQKQQLRSGYLKNLLKPKSWLRLLTFQSDYRVLFKAFKNQFGASNKAVMNKVPSSGAGSEMTERGNTNPHFAPAFFSMLKASRPMLLVFSGNDRLGSEFEEKFVELNRSRLEPYADLYSIHTIENANHIFSEPGWMKEMIDRSCQWLDRFE